VGLLIVELIKVIMSIVIFIIISIVKLCKKNVRAVHSYLSKIAAKIQTGSQKTTSAELKRGGATSIATP